MSEPVRGVPILVIAVAIIEVLSVVVIRADIHLLSNGGCECNRTRVSFLFEVEEGCVSQMLALHIWVRRGKVEVFMIVSGAHEPHTIIIVDIARLFLEQIRPLPTIVTPVTMIGL